MRDWQFGITIRQERMSIITVRVSAETEDEAKRKALAAARDHRDLEDFAHDGERWWDDGEITTDGLDEDDFPVADYDADIDATEPPIEAGSAEEKQLLEAAGQLRLQALEGR